jgi:hypothetical protein
LLMLWLSCFQCRPWIFAANVHLRVADILRIPQ